MENEAKESVVIVEENDNEPVAEKNDDLSPGELEMAKKLKVDVSPVDEKKEEPKSVNKKEEKVSEKTDDIPVEELDSFEKLHDIYKSKPEAFYRLPKNIKQLYHSQKWLYKRMKDEEEKRKKIEDDVGLSKIKDSVARIKLDRIKNRLSNPEGLTVEELQELIDEKREAEDKDNRDKPITVKDLEEIENKKREEETRKETEEKERQSNVTRRIQEAEVIAKESISDITGGKYDNFDEVVVLAQEMIKSKDRYGAQVAGVINSDADVQEIVDVLVDIAKLNPKWGTSDKTDEKSGKKIDKESVDKLVKNASRQATSASLTGGRGSREIHISEDMDLEEAYRVWDKIPREMQRKILKRA